MIQNNNAISLNNAIKFLKMKITILIAFKTFNIKMIHLINKSYFN